MRKSFLTLTSAVAVLLLTLSGVRPAENNLPWKKFAGDQKVDSILSTMTVREMIAQLIWIPAWADKKGGNYRQVEDLVTKYGIGGVIFFEGSRDLQVDFTERLSRVSRIPLIIAQDAEWGTGMRLREVEDFPYQMTMGAVQNDSLIYKMGAAVAWQCRDIGVNLNLAPVADVNNNPLNPVINYRSFGENPEQVAEKAAMYMKGLQDNGIIACAKHFPGHGDTDTDSHTGLPVIRGDRDRFDQVELVPFRRLVDEGVGAVMTAHITVPGLDKSGIPATFSHKVVSGLLREEAHFRGLILTDAMNMAGATMTFPSGVADAEALKAGNDIIEYSTDPVRAIDEIARRVEKGEIAVSEVKERCRKLLEAKMWLESQRSVHGEALIACNDSAVAAGTVMPAPETVPSLADGNIPAPAHAGIPGAEHPALIRDLYAGAMTLLENNNNLLPIGRTDQMRIATVSVNRLAMTEFQKMTDRYTNADHFFIDPSNEQGAQFVLSKLSDYDVVIAGFCALEQKPAGLYGVTTALNRVFSRIASLDRSAIIWFGNPYGIARLDMTAKPSALLVAYQDNSYTQQVAVQVLFGAIGAAGRLPVTINETYPAGTGIKTAGNIRLQFGFPENAGLSTVRLISRIDSIVQEGLDSLAYPGCHVLIARKGVVVLNKCYGFHLFDSTEAVSEYDLWDLASVTKVSAATPSLMLLTDRGLFDPDRTLGYYLPWFRFSNKGDMVLRDMLAHQAGLRSWIPFWRNTMENDSTFRKGVFSDYTNRRFTLPVSDSLYMNRHYLRDMFREIRDSPVGSKKYVYSDLTFILAAEIIESLTDSTIDRFVPANIYRPIGALNITYNPLEKYPRERIVPTEYDSLFRRQLLRGTVHDEGTAMLGGVSGHAGLFATGNDLLKLVEMYRRGGEYGGVRVLSSDVLKEFTRVQYPENENRRALGFDKPLLGNDTIPPDEAYPCYSASPLSFGHSGFTGTFIWVDPEEEISYVFLSNRVYPTRNNNRLSDLSIRGRILQAVYDSKTD
ncbi:MAG: glycoside hydrolase family 3 N-terminal domain-containing protein [Bacteroidales bacterium]|jgi:beta-glucosidase-like glycosyl hydrolase/CubicO group peptidase (beta-lactamase class C family)|nr:glycoside hydrolase family 3 N-terminal domain-containing protein [Bacteroidales bacterium]